MLSFLLACLRSDLAGGGGGGPFTITGVNLSQRQAGTSCVNPHKLNVSLIYTGSASGKTVTVTRSWDGGAFETIDTGLDPAGDFPYPVDSIGWYNKFGIFVPSIVTVTDDSDSGNTATSAEYQTSYTLCV